MLQRSLFNKTLPCLSNFLRLGYVNKFSNGPIKDDDNTPPSTEKKTEESPKDEAPSDSEELSRLLDASATYSNDNDNWATTPYPKDAPVYQKKDDSNDEPQSPMDHSVVLFPGQGIVKVGMVKNYLRFPQVKELFEIANEVLNYDLLKICLNGPQEKLNETQFNQPATVVCSLAALEKLREERPRAFETCVATAGYSVGEITSLIFSGAISFEDGMRLVSIRGTAMRFASERSRQGMLSVYCTPQSKVYEACENAQKWAMDMGVENPVCRVAVFLYTQGKILAGNEEALQYIEKNSKKLGLTKPTRLPVSGAFHTPLMEPALKAIFKVLCTVEIDTPRCKVYSNYTGEPHKNERFMKKLILKQIVSPVKWEQCMHDLFERPGDKSFPRIFDVGSGGRMKTVLKLINARACNFCIVV